MSFYKRVVIAGKTEETKKYYSRKHQPKTKRVKRGKPSRAEQININIRKQVEQLRWTLNCNFEEGDFFATFSFKKEERPDTYEELIKCKDKLIRELRKAYRSKGRELKFVYVIEIGKRGAAHIHMVLKSIDTKVLKRCWDRGYIHINLLDSTGQYGDLASYLVKEKGRRKMEQCGGKTYSASRNLKKPIIKKQVIWNRDFFREDARSRKGYYIDKRHDEENGGIRKGYTMTGYPFMEYIQVKIDGREVKRE